MGILPIPNFDQLPTEFKAIPAGIYICTVKSYEMATPKNGGDLYVKWQLSVVKDLKGSADNAGRVLFHNTFVTEKAAWTSAAFTVACGLKRNPTGFDPDACIGKAVKVAVVLSEYPKGSKKFTNQVEEVMVIGL